MLHRWGAAVPLLLGCLLCGTGSAQVGSPDPRIKAALNGISAEHIRTDIEKLVGFQNRSTLSAQDSAAIAQGHGIGAAREWIKSEFERYSRDCGGCLEVKTDTFTQPVSERVSSPTVITNVYAVLKGTDPEDAKRIVLVTGHYDSRNGSNENVTDAAPARTTTQAGRQSVSNAREY